MPARTMFTWAILSVALTACGCGSTGVVTRAQNAHAPGHDQHTSYYTDDSGSQEQGAYCPSDETLHGYDGICPHGVRGGCPSCGPGCGRCPDWTPTHHKTYSYSVPRDLSYPEQNAVGGAVVYPYYTHKGPSDFFRQK